MVKPYVRIDQRRLRGHRTPKRCPGPAGVAIDQHANHLLDVAFRARQPVGERQEVGAQILSLPRDVFQDLGQATQQTHLLGAGARAPGAFGLEALQKGQRGAFLPVHLQTTAARKLGDLRRR